MPDRSPAGIDDPHPNGRSAALQGKTQYRVDVADTQAQHQQPVEADCHAGTIRQPVLQCAEQATIDPDRRQTLRTSLG